MTKSTAPPPTVVKSADGVPIHYQVYGTGTPVLLLVHGWSCDQTYWKMQIDHLAVHHQVVTLDLAGHGKSGIERQHWSIPAFAQDVVAVVEDLGLSRVILVGHSMGGPVVLETSCLIPSRVSALVGVDTFPDKWVNFEDSQREQFLEPFHSDFVQATRSWVSGQLFLPSSAPALIQRISEDMSAAPPSVAIPAMEAIYEWGKRDCVQALQKLRSHVFMIQAQRNENNLQVMSSLAPSFPSFQVSWMPAVGHFPMLEDPETFNHILTGIIEKLPR
ncbi:MAG: alpha/beta hydrolase [Acidobacteriota bacterium]